MLCSNAYVVSDEFFDYDGKTPTAHHDENGIGPLYRLYPAQAGWVFLAAPLDADWDELRQALATVTGADVLGDDPRFATPADRAGHGPELAAALAAIFSSRPAADWEARLVPQDVACVEVSRGPFSEFTINDPTMVDNGFVAEVEHPLFGRHHRHGPIVTMASTPGTPGPGCLVGQHTRRILSELGYTDDQMAELAGPPHRGLAGAARAPAGLSCAGRAQSGAGRTYWGRSASRTRPGSAAVPGDQRGWVARPVASTSVTT